jgi:2-polyprenyl-3-methyl-5-hydroxy-6-metoxy-1,4-benzoquinol methylase
MAVSFWEYMRIGAPQWRGQATWAKQWVWYFLGAPDMHARIRNTHVCNVVERLSLPSDAHVLDTGCGRGISLFYLAGKHPNWQLTGLELDDEMVGSCQRAAVAGHWHNVNFIKTTVDELSDSNVYDMALCMDVLEHIPDDIGLLRRINRALKPGGYLVLHVPRRRQEQWRMWRTFTQHEVDGHVRNEYVEDELRHVFAEADLHILELHQTFGKLAETAFEMNLAFWRIWPLRQAVAILTYPLAMPLGYPDTRHYQVRGNSFLVLAQRQ